MVNGDPQCLIQTLQLSVECEKPGQTADTQIWLYLRGVCKVGCILTICLLPMTGMCATGDVCQRVTVCMLLAHLDVGSGD